MAVVIELLSRNNQVLNHQVLGLSSATLGRAFSCDKHIDDPYVCAQHLNISIDESGAINIQDNDSVNGVRVNDKVVSEAQVNADDIITVGRSRFRIFAADSSLAPTKKLNPMEEYIDRFAKRRFFFGLLIALTILTTIDSYFGTFSKFEVSSLIASIGGMLLVVCIVPFIFGLLSILNKKDARLITQFNLVLVSLVSVLLFSYLIKFLLFNFDKTSLIVSVETLFTWGCSIVVFWLALYVAFHQSNRKRNAIVFAVFGALACAKLLPGFFDENNYIENPNANAFIISPIFLISKPESTQDFVSSGEDLFKEAERESDDF